MTTETQPLALNPALPIQLAAAAATAGLQVLEAQPATSVAGNATTRFMLALQGQSAPALQLELSNTFTPAEPSFAEPLATFFGEVAHRLRNPRPDTFITLTGIPLSYSEFAWPFHESAAGADTSLVHGLVTLADGTESPLHAKISAAMTVTFREIVRAPEQPFAESFILNAVRKTFDQGQLELVKSGNRQPVPVTTRYYSPRTQKFVFNDTTEPQRRAFLAAKTFWLSGILGASASGAPSPVWLLDPRDAQYLNATVAELKISAETLAREGLITFATDPAYASPTAALLGQQDAYREALAHALAAIKPAFNEEMRGGHTNM